MPCRNPAQKRLCHVITLTVAADQKIAVYTDAEGAETEMTNAVEEDPKVVIIGSGTFHVDAYNADAAVTANLYDDDTFQYAYEKFGLVENGTWKFENYKFTVNQSNGTEIVTELDDAYNMSFEYTAVASDQLVDTFTAERGAWGPALAQ